MAERDEFAAAIEALLAGTVRRVAALEDDLARLAVHVRTDATVYAAVRQDAGVSVANNTLVELTWDVVEEDTAGILQGGALVAPRDGIYLVTAYVRWEINSSGLRRTSLRYYDADGIYKRLVASGSANGDGTRQADSAATAILRMTAGEQIRVGTLQTSGVTLTATGRAEMFMLRG